MVRSWRVSCAPCASRAVRNVRTRFRARRKPPRKPRTGTEFTGAYARRFADTYDNLQTGFARNLIKDGKISEKDIAALESKVMDCICAQAQSEDDFPTFDLTDGALTPVPYTGANAQKDNRVAKECMERYDGYKLSDLSQYVYRHEHPDDTHLSN